MNELWARVGLVAAALAVAGVVALVARRRANAEVRTIKVKDLAAGVYLFSSAACATCERARDRLIRSLGADGYTEFAWERHPEAFAEYGIDRVPAVLVVGEEGRGRLQFGQPNRALGP